MWAAFCRQVCSCSWPCSVSSPSSLRGAADWGCPDRFRFWGTGSSPRSISVRRETKGCGTDLFHEYLFTNYLLSSSPIGFGNPCRTDLMPHFGSAKAACFLRTEWYSPQKNISNSNAKFGQYYFCCLHFRHILMREPWMHTSGTKYSEIANLHTNFSIFISNRS